MRDPYDVLGVSKNASEAEIKKAFRSLAKTHHPDTRGGDPAAQKKFQEISAAYDIVGDKDKRAKFDQGAIDANGNPRGFDPGAGGFRPGAGPGDFQFAWGNPEGAEAGFSAEDILGEIFGGGGRRRRRRARRGEDYSLAMTIGFEEAALGGTRRLTLPGGHELDVRIPIGVRDGQQIRLKGQGGPGGGENAPSGDLLLTVHVSSHPWLTRDANDLKMDLPVTLKEAVLGGKANVPTLTGPVTLTIPAGSNTGRSLRLKGKGIPAHAGQPAGDLYVKLVVMLPDKPDPALKEFAADWSPDYNPRARLG